MQGRRAGSRRVVAAIALATTLAACSGGGDDEVTRATVPASLATTTTTTDPYAVPEVIDAAYVNRVLAAMDAGIGEVVRIIYRTREMRAEVYDRLRAFYAEGGSLRIKIQGLQDDLLDDLKAYRPNPGDARTTVTQLIAASPACIFIKVDRDYAAVGVNPDPENGVLWMALRPLDPNRDINNYNPTTWMVDYEGFEPGRRAPSNPCA